ncbi:hypothetical protein [Phytomonospora endophytica]|uniref:Outer membrane protein assembly factor BamB n=1 Tax=Phytomonospora endophytica TaxID=714109 RepID=A0A841FFV1_9ACTN|nr:hypothetical protein [Phytomonospora endophytica]MBB6032432.1 outer membrane protein assembly factor BamB [Phytomonospora endophytica]GIG66421.1 hypothetical protein Pen01_27160 [Phytomonospora endophytica]
MRLTLTRVLGDVPFTEIGKPTVVARRGGLVAVGGDLASLYWDGNQSADTLWGRHRLGVYEDGGERCRVLLETDSAIRDLAFHPALPLVAVGTGGYDGGNYFTGELLILDVETSVTVSVTGDDREVRRVRWTNARTLDVLVAPPNDDDFTDARHRSFREVIVRDDWRAPGTHLFGEHRDADSVPTPKAVHETWKSRGQVWAVAPHEGGVLAARDGVVAEKWSADGEPAWSVSHAGGARQLLVDPGGGTALVNVTHRLGDGRDLVARVSLDDGRVLAEFGEGWPVVLSGAEDGSVLLRHTSHREEHPAVLFDPSGRLVTTVELFGCDTVNHPFAVGGAARPLVLVGEPDAPHRNKWVAAVDGEGVGRLFPVEWDAVLDRHLFGGPGVVTGGTLVHAGTVYHGHGLLPGNAFVVARDARTGEARWVHTADVPVTAVDTDGERVYAAFNTGEVVVLALDDGTVLHREELQVRGRPAVALSLAIDGPGRLLAGTVDGRILDLAVVHGS